MEIAYEQWYFLAYSYSQNFQEVFDGTSIHEITYKINKWKVGMKDRRLYKEKASIKNVEYNRSEERL